MKSIQKSKYGEIEVFQFSFKLPGAIKLGVHLFYIDGLLIDTGPSRLRKEILETIRSLPVKQIFVTHHHEDHSGNLKQLQLIFKCPIYATPSCCLMMKKPPPISLSQKIYWGERPPFFDLIPKDNRIETDNFSFEIIPTPGHAVDMAILYEPNKRWLFVADLYVSYVINYFLDSEGMAQQIESIKKVLELDWDFMFCSHNPNIKCGRNEMESKLKFLEKFYADVAELYQQGLTGRQIFKKLNLKEDWAVRLSSGGNLSKMNMVKAVIRDERRKS